MTVTGVGGDFGFAGISNCLFIDPGGGREISRWRRGREPTGDGAMAPGIPAGTRQGCKNAEAICPLSHHLLRPATGYDLSSRRDEQQFCVA